MPDRARPPLAVLVTLLLFAGILAAAVAVGHRTGSGAAGPTAAPAPAEPDAAPRTLRVAPRPAAPPRRLPGRVPSPGPSASAPGWSGLAFDACRAPSQRTMDRWLHRSPFLGVGIYLGGVHRACEQRHLTPLWVARQARAGWRLLPIWVGPQASCTGYRWRIDGRPGRDGAYRAAARDGRREARSAVATARGLGIGPGETLWYDIEPFRTHRRHCRMSSLTFLDAWTRELHRRGYQAGVYSHVKAGVALLHRAPRRFARPDAVWYAWVTRDAGALPARFVPDPSWMRTSRVHQFALDRRVRFGGVSMAIDWNHVTLGGGAASTATAPCGAAADRLRHPELTPGARGPAVRVARCLLPPVGREGRPADDVLGPSAQRAVRRFQESRRLGATGTVDRRTWTALLAQGTRPVLKQGSTGEPVRRLQRALDAALPREVAVDGRFGPLTAAAVRRYQQLMGHARTGIVTGATWRALGQGRVAAPARPSRPAARPDATPASGKPAPGQHAQGKQTQGMPDRSGQGSKGKPKGDRGGR
jgi:peptidoglycan hydrolase-like protein with peptidoglycan-binding domain